MRVGIYGGSFNPVHRGHIQIMKILQEVYHSISFFLLVSPLNPFKRGASYSQLAPYEHRLAMARLATDNLPGVYVSDFERHLPLPSYTFNTLSALSRAYPEHEFQLVIGADSWQSFPRWYRAQDILDRYEVLVFRRPGYTIDEASLPPTVHVIDAPQCDISSTQIRQAIAAGSDALNEWLDPKVIDYIRQHRLYQPLPNSRRSEVEAGGGGADDLVEGHRLFPQHHAHLSE